MKLDRRFFASLLVVCLMLGSILPASAATLQATYGEATYYDIAVTNYSRMLAFQNGVVAAANADKQYGLIDATGKVVIPFQYGGVWALGGNLFKVSDDGSGRGGKQGIIDSTGKVVREMQENVYITAQNDTVCILNRDNWERTYYTTDMKPSCECAYWSAPGTSPSLTAYDSWLHTPDDYYVVQKYGEDWGDSTYSVLDKNYQSILTVKGYLSPRTDQVRSVYMSSTALYDINGKVIVADGTYDSISDRGRIFVVTKDEQMGALDYTGKVVVPLGDYDEIGNRNEGGYITAVVKGDTPTTKVFKDGKEVKTFEGKRVTSEIYFRNFAFTTSTQRYSGKNGIIDLNGKVLLEERYDMIAGDNNGNLKVCSYGSSENGWTSVYGLYAQDGKQIFADQYATINYLKDNKYLLCNQSGSYGVKKLDGSDVIPMRYKDIRTYTTDFIELFDGTYRSIVNLNNETIVPKTKDAIRLFKSTSDYFYDLYDVDSLAASDHYDKTVQPFCIKTDDGGYVTVYADYQKGTTSGSVPVRASNINDKGMFAYQAADGRFGFATLGGNGSTPAPAPAKPKVVPTSQNLTVNGAKKDTEIYNINGNNFFKLRDMAALLNGTSSQFSVAWDASSGTIAVKTGEAYTAVGGELATGTDKSASAVVSAQKVMINGAAVELTAYNIGGNNFFKLRDLGEKLNFNVEWDGATSTMVVTSK